MQTLYDQLGVRPEDDRDRIKQAFRDAIKSTHPDIVRNDPMAPVRFRHIVRAHSILSDPELRADYDNMLARERQLAEASAKGGVVSDTMAKIKSDAIAIAVLVVVMLGGYGVFVYVTRTSDAAGKVAGAPAAAAAVAPAPQLAAAVINEPRDVSRNASLGSAERDEIPHEASALGAAVVTTAGADAVVVAAPAEIVARDEVIAAIGPAREPAPASDSAPRTAAFYREQGVLAYRAGDFNRAIAAFDLAISLDPNFEGAYIDRGIVLYRIGQLERAFADVAQAKRIAGSSRRSRSSGKN